MLNKTVKIIVGRVCSGKTHLSKKIAAEHEGYAQIVEAGNIAREKTGEKRESASGDHDEYICNRIEEISKKSAADCIIVPGIRQMSLLNMVSKLFTDVEVIYVYAPTSVREKRFAKRRAKKDANITMREAEKIDEDLGLCNTISWLIKHRGVKHISTNDS